VDCELDHYSRSGSHNRDARSVPGRCRTDVRKAEAEAAIALLLDLVSDTPKLESLRFALRFYTHEQKLWDRAKTTILRLQSDEKWLSAWNDPQKKCDVLTSLIEAIETAKTNAPNSGAG
jgi:hypothetical protein